MAKLLNKPYPGDWNDRPGEDFKDTLVRTDKMLVDLEARVPKSIAKSCVGVILDFPVADGVATYVVVKDKPLTLQWVPHGDKWTISSAHIRGLTVADVKEQYRSYKMTKRVLAEI